MFRSLLSAIDRLAPGHAPEQAPRSFVLTERRGRLVTHLLTVPASEATPAHTLVVRYREDEVPDHTARSVLDGLRLVPAAAAARTRRPLPRGIAADAFLQASLGGRWTLDLDSAR